MKPTVKTIARQPSWVVRNRQVELAVTQLGGHMAPVNFHRDSSAPVQPYYINPWHGDGIRIDEPVLVPLRGDFFCMPFGGYNAYRAERHVAHGETATAKWRLGSAGRSGPVTTLQLSLRTKVRPGKVTKRLQLVEGHNAVYVQHVLEGYSGAMSLGHHATLDVPPEPGSLRVATSPILFGSTSPTLFSDPAAGEYQSMAIDKQFRDLRRVPLIWAEERFGDFTAFPARPGFTDLVACFNKPDNFPAWTTATVEQSGYVWFSLKDPAVLPTTLLWASNGGRHGPPWNGRNRCLGLEDVCAYFADGLGASARANALSRDGIATVVRLSPRTPTLVNYVEGVVRVPPGFQRVRNVRFESGRATFVSVTGKRVTADVAHEFVRTGSL